MPPDTLEALLAEAGWLSRLALGLTRDAAEAADAVQETYAAALRSPPEDDRPVRPWLRRVLENALRMRRRGERRRSVRDQGYEALRAEVPTPEELLERAQAQRDLAERVLALDEPFRSMVLLRYHEGLSAERIATLLRVPAATVRGRLKTALDRLRRDLDAGPRKHTWQRLLLPLGGRLLVTKTSKGAILALAVLLLVATGVGAALVARHGGRGGGSHPAPIGQHGAPRGHASPARDPAQVAPEVPGLFVQPGLAARRIAGRVTSAGAPFAGAVVRLSLVATQDTLAETRTGPDGRFDLGARAAAAYDVSAEATDLTGAVVEVDLRRPGVSPAPDALELTLLPCDYPLTGRVRDAAGSGIPRARVSTSTPWPATEAGIDGAYRLCLRWGATVVVYGADGYNTLTLEVHAGGPLRRDVVLIPEAVVSGRAVRAEDDTPVEQAFVTLTPNPRGPSPGARVSAVSGADGSFRLTGVTAGRNILAAVSTAGSTPRPIELVAEAGRSIDGLVVRLEPAARVAGRVVRDGQPVAGVGVGFRVANVAQGGYQAVTQADGRFELAHVPRGEVGVFVEDHTVVAPRLLRVPVANDVTIEVAALAALSGRVLRAGQPVAGARLSCTDALTGADGRYECAGLPAGAYTVDAYDEHGAWGNVSLVLAAGDRREVDVTLDLDASVCGTVVNAQAAPVPWVDVRVTSLREQDYGEAQTDAGGRFCARRLAGSADYVAAVYPAGTFARPFAPAEPFPPLHLDDGHAHVTGVRLIIVDDDLAISGAVSDAAGAPVPDAVIFAQPWTEGSTLVFDAFRGHPTPSTVSDAGGGFRVTGLQRGTYALLARGRDGGEAVLKPVEAGASGARLALQRAGAIEGRIVGFGSTPAVVAIVDRYDRPPEDAQIDGDHFRIGALAPGRYIVTAVSGPEADLQVAVVSPGEVATVNLTSRGSASISGRAVVFGKGTPVPGVRCETAPRAGLNIGVQYSGTDSQVVADADGRFVLERVPAGDILLICAAQRPAGGTKLLSLAPGEHADVEVPVVVRDSQPLATIGMQLGGLTNTVAEVSPGGPADRAGLRVGDAILGVDGVPVSGLLGRGLGMLLSQRPAGSTAALVIQRGDARLAIALVVGPPE